MRTRGTYKLQHPDLIQPKDPNHPLYKIVDEFIIDGDQREIAAKLKINDAVVSNVKRGRERSRRVWDQIIVRVMRRKKEQEKVLSYLQQGIKTP